MKCLKHFAYDVTIHLISRDRMGKCKSVTGHMPAYIHLMSIQVTPLGCSAALFGMKQKQILCHNDLCQDKLLQNIMQTY